MAIRFNPFTSSFDFVGSGSVTSWKAPVANFAALPVVGNIDGDVRAVLDVQQAYQWKAGTSSWIYLNDVNIGAFSGSSSTTGIIVDANTNTIHITPADATNPGAITTGAQTLAGDKTFQNNIFADGGIDTSGAGTLAIGTVNASIINLGNASATVNFNGTVNNNNVTNLNVADQLITINSGGGSGSASGTGFEIEEAASITGYIKTSGDRNDFVIKTPNKAGIITLPGQTTADSVALLAASQVLTNKTIDADLNTLSNIENADIKAGAAIDATKIADGSVTNTEFQYIGSLTSDAQTQLNARVVGPASATDNAITRYDGTTGKLVQNSLAIIDDLGNLTATNVSGTNTGDVTLNPVGTSPNVNAATLVGQILNLEPADATNPGVVSVLTQTFSGDKTFNDDVIIVGTTTLNTGLTGPVRATAGVISTGNTSLTSEVTGILPLANGGTNKNMVASAGAVAYSDADSLELTAVGIAGQQVLLSNGTAAPSWTDFIAPSPGDLTEDSDVVANNQSSALDVVGFSFNNASIRSFKAIASVTIDATSDLYEQFELNGLQKSGVWELVQTSIGDTSGVTLSITNTGQIQYTSPTYPGYVSGKISFRAMVTVV